MPLPITPPPCGCPEDTNMVIIGDSVFCDYIDTLVPTCSPVTCPDGYTYDEEEDICVKQYFTANLCPDGYVYNAQARTCTQYIVYPADCICLADVTANSQTICSGTATAINLVSTLPGVRYSWTVSQTSGVSGGSNSNGVTTTSVITQNLLTTVGGTATYTITPYESGGCSGQPITVVVTVNPSPNIIATPSSPQTIASGGIVNTTLSSTAIGTTFSWTVAAPATLTGATAGSGNIISNTLTASVAGVATYHIIATAPGGCISTLDYVVNVGATVTTCLSTLTARVMYDGQASQYTNNTTVSSITLTGTTGGATIEINYFIKPIVYNTSLTQTATNFAATNSTVFSGVTVTSSGPVITFTRTTAATYTPILRNIEGDLNGSLSVPGGIINPLWDLASSTGHGCNRARFEFMTNGVSVGLVNLNNGANTTVGQIFPQQHDDGNVIPNPTIGQPGFPNTYPVSSRLSTVTYNATEIANIALGLPSTTNILKVRLRGTNIVPPTTASGLLEPLYYDQHSSVVGLEFFVNGISVYKGQIGKKVLVLDPCQPTLTPRVYETSTGGTSTITDIFWGSFTGTLTAGTPIVANTVTQIANVTVATIGTYDFIAYSNGITFRATGTFTTNGVQAVTLKALGTPIVAGTSSFIPDLSISATGDYDRIPPSFTRTIT